MILQGENTHITGWIREPLLMIEWSIFFLFLELALIFLVRYFYNQNQLKTLQEIAYFWLFLGFSFSKMFYIIGDFYVPLELRYNYYYVAYIIQIMGIYFFVFFIEKYRTFSKRYVFSKIMAALIGIFMIILLFFTEYTQWSSYMFFFGFLIFIISLTRAIYTDFYKKKLMVHRSLHFIEMITGIALVMVGLALATDASASIFGIEIRMVGDFLELAGFIFLFSFFRSVPSFSEYEWKKALDYLIITNGRGLIIYNKNFLQEESIIDKNIVAGVITSIEMMLKQLTERPGLSVIEKKDKYLLILPGKNITGIMIASENLATLRILLKRFIGTVETIFENVLADWRGDLRKLRAIDSIAEEFFS